MEDNSQVYDTPSLQQEAEANGIEIMESSTDQIQYDDNEGVPLSKLRGKSLPLIPKKMLKKVKSLLQVVIRKRVRKTFRKK